MDMVDGDTDCINIRISPHKAGIVLAILALCAGGGYSATKFAEWFLKPEYDYGLYKFFDIGGESNLPTYISAQLLLSASILLSLIAVGKKRVNKRLSRPWIGLALGFAFLSLDEVAMIHEGIVGPLFLAHFGGEGWFWHWGWYVPFIPVVLFIGAIYVPFLKTLPPKTAILFVSAGCIFVGGAIGIEMIESYISYYLIGGGAMALALLIEEMCEMLGVVVFIYALLDYIAKSNNKFIISGSTLIDKEGDREVEKDVALAKS